eukprot:28998_1
MKYIVMIYYNGIYIYSDIVFQGGNSVFTDPNHERILASHVPNLQINTDVFWDENINSNGEQITTEWIQNACNSWVNTETYGFGFIDLRAVATTFGDLDIQQVWPYYYGGGDENAYNQLREIKSTLDPQVLFSNKFTIPPLTV